MKPLDVVKRRDRARRGHQKAQSIVKHGDCRIIWNDAFGCCKMKKLGVSPASEGQNEVQRGECRTILASITEGRVG